MSDAVLQTAGTQGAAEVLAKQPRGWDNRTVSSSTAAPEQRAERERERRESESGAK